MVMMKNVLLVFISFCLFISCSSDDLRELERARDKWENLGIKDYIIKERISCFCAGIFEWELYVENEQKVKVTYKEPDYGTNQTYEDILENAKTIDDVFDFIESIDDENLDAFEVTYHKEYGYPISIYIDHKENIADDEIGYFYELVSPEL